MVVATLQRSKGRLIDVLIKLNECHEKVKIYQCSSETYSWRSCARTL